MTTDTFLKTLATGWWLLLIGAVIGALAAGGLLLVAPKQYEATARVLVSPAGQNEGGGEQITFVSSMIPTFVALGESDANMAQIAERLGGEETPADVREKIGYAPEEGTSIIVVTGRAATPEAAARTTQVAGDVLVRTVPGMYDEEIAVDATVLEEATTPTVPASPDPMIVLPAGMLLGMLVAFLAMVGTGHRRRPPRHVNDLTEATGAALLGVLDPSRGSLRRDCAREGIPTTMIGVCGRIRRLPHRQIVMMSVGSGDSRMLADRARTEAALVGGDLDGHPVGRMGGDPTDPTDDVADGFVGELVGDPGPIIYALIFEDEVARLPASATVVLTLGPECTAAQAARAARFVVGHGSRVGGVVVTEPSRPRAPSPTHSATPTRSPSRMRPQPWPASATPTPDTPGSTSDDPAPAREMASTAREPERAGEDTP